MPPVSSGVTAFFTRSSAANIPVSRLCEELGLNPDTYSVYSTCFNCNMANSVSDHLTLLLQYLAHSGWPGVVSVSLLGASGVAGGSLLLIPVSLSLLASPMIWHASRQRRLYHWGHQGLAKQPSTLRQMRSSLPSPKWAAGQKKNY